MHTVNIFSGNSVTLIVPGKQYNESNLHRKEACLCWNDNDLILQFNAFSAWFNWKYHKQNCRNCLVNSFLDDSVMDSASMKSVLKYT